MPLKLIQRPGTAFLYVRGAVRGQSVFESTGTADPQKAEAYRAKREAELWDRSIYGAKREAELWDRSIYGAKAVVSFAHAVTSYLEDRERRPAARPGCQGAGANG